METRRSTRLIQKENSKPPTAFQTTKQNTLNDDSNSKSKRNGSAASLTTKTTKSSYFDPDFSEESDSESDSPPVKRRARITTARKSTQSKKRYDSENESSSDEFVQKPKSITEILESKSELKLSSDESDSSDESPSKRKKKSDGSPMKKLTTSKINSDSDSSDEFVKPNKSSNLVNNVTKTEPLDERDIKEEKQSSQAEYFDFTALVNKVKANENITPVEEFKIEPEPESKKSEKSTPRKSKKSTRKPDTKPEEKADLEVFELLAMGEDTDMSATDIKESVAQSSQGNYEIPNQVEVLLDAPALKKKKHTDLEMTLRRRLNFIRRENQVYVHKVDILCWIAHGMYINSILNSPDLLSLALSLLPSDKCYPAKRMDMGYLEKLIEWFVKKIKLRKEPTDDGNFQLFVSLQSQFQKLEAENKRDLCFMFICIIRALGIKCRLIVNLNVVPIKPTSDQLLPITVKKDTVTPTSTKKMLQKENSSKNNKTNIKSKPESSKTSSKETPKKEQPSRSETKRSSQNKSEKSNDKQTPSKHRSEKSKDSSSKNYTKEKPKNTPETSPHLTKRSSRSQSSKSNESKSSKNGPNDESASSKSNKESVEKEPPRRSARSKSSSSKNQSKYFEKDKSHKSERLANSSYFSKEAEETKSSKSKDSSKSMKSKDSKKSTHDKSKASKKVEPENLVEEMSTSDESDDDTDTTFVPTKKKKKIDRRVLSSEEDVHVEEKTDTKNKQNKLNYWLEVFLEAEEQWTCVDIAKKSYHCVQQLYNQTTHPVRYIIAFNNDQTIKDVTRRYVPQYLSITRKLRVDDAWWKSTMDPFKPAQDPRDEEDEALEKVLEEQPLPTAISEYKNHPLYALKRHLLKFQAIYPPDAPPLGFVKGEPVYSRLCVVQLHGREMWIKEAKVVKMGEKPYKIVKGRQKKDKFGTDEGPKDLELFGLWQTEDYDPPTAENGIVPRNSFGNVELFKPCMLPKGTVYLQIPGLMRIANKLNIDCAAAITGFEYSTNGWSYPVKDGFVVCEEFKDILLDAYHQEVEEAEKRERQKREERVYANWKRLIKGMFIRERLKRKYNFGDPGTSSEQDKTESK